MKVQQKVYVWFRESAVQSIVADIFCFGFLGLLGAFDHFVLNDSKVVAVLFFFVFLMYTAGKANSRKTEFTNLDDLKEYVNNLQD